MNDIETLDPLIQRLRSNAPSIRCNEMAEILESLGFEVRNGKKQGHKVFVHHGIAAFTSAAYTCGHGRNPEIKPVYVRKVAGLLKQYETELILFLGENQ
ncbi:MAG: type II toxin-antitoxin system HicA family toxin [Gammaproteobacteria bacterium]|nr:type II toxin-antitoxin system HicA family toxin [Gammaproteobacteria bacterium]